MFKYIAGLVLGRSYEFSEEMNDKWENYAMEVTIIGGKDFPLLSRFDVGHTAPLLAIPFRAKLEMDSDEDIWAMGRPACCDGDKRLGDGCIPMKYRLR